MSQDHVETPMSAMRREILLAAHCERERQDKKWGADVGRIPGVGRRHDGSPMTSEDYGLPSEEAAKVREKMWREDGNESLAASAVEELAEAISCGDDEVKMRGEVLQLLALCVKWVEGIDLRAAKRAERCPSEP